MPEEILEALLLPPVHLIDEKKETQGDRVMYQNHTGSKFRDGIRNRSFHLQSSDNEEEEENLCNALPH